MFAGVAFDLDGTLVDSIADIGHALNCALREASLPTFEVSLVRTWVGDGPDGLIRRALAHLDIDDPHQKLGAQLRAGYDRAALAAPLEHGCVYPGIDVALATLAMRTPLAVVTNKPTHLARAVLAAANLAQHFRSVHGADHHALRKPAPAMLQAAATQLGVTTTHMAMVGDSAADLGAATRAGCAAVFVDWGYGRPELPPDDRWRDPAPRFARVTSADALLKTLLEP